MASKRDAYKYHFVVGDKIAYRGVTNDLERSEMVGLGGRFRQERRRESLSLPYSPIQIDCYDRF